MCQECLYRRGGSRPGLWERCRGIENVIGLFMFSFCCGMFRGENGGRWDIEEVFGGASHLDIILSAVLLAS